MLNALSSRLHSLRHLCDRREASPEPQPQVQPALPRRRPRPYPEPRQELLSHRRIHRAHRFIPGLNFPQPEPPALTPRATPEPEQTPEPQRTLEPELPPEPKLEITEGSTTPKPQPLAPQSYQQLKEGECINDLVINKTLTRLQREHEDQHSNGLVNSFFYYCFAAKKPMLLPRHVDLQQFTADQVFWPCHSSNHWFLVVVDNRHQCLWVVDSFYGRNLVDQDVSVCSQTSMEFAKRIRGWHQRLMADHGETERAEALPNWPVLRQPVPMQRNDKDCGVAILWAAEQLMQGNSALGSVRAAAPYQDYRQHLCQYFQPTVSTNRTSPD